MSLTLLCPVDGLPLKVAFTLAPAMKGSPGDGDFTRDPSQHTHNVYMGDQAQCVNGHTWAWEDFDLILRRVDPNVKPDINKETR